ncbi:MAG: response regulator [Cyanobacteria bacterium P01_F01_bin.150]
MMSNIASSTRILIVDDNPMNLKVLSDAIRDQADWTILVATDGESAIDQAQYAHPDLILLDVMMPGIDGFETCKRLKGLDDVQTVPIIFMTALADTEHKVYGLELGAVDYITKPFQKAEVIARVKLHLKLNHLSKSLKAKNNLLVQKIEEKDIAEAQLQALTQHLEERVEQRTAELSESLEQLKMAQLQLVQQEKMSTLGNLVSGIAHEINNPVGFLQGNLQPTQEYVQSLISLIYLYQEKFPQSHPDIDARIASMDFDFICQDLNKILESMDVGIERIRNISVSLRIFSRRDLEQKFLFAIAEGIDSTLLILQHRLKANSMRPKIEVIKDVKDIPLVHCFAGQINQVIMNLIANAIDAIDEASLDHSFEYLEQNPNMITISVEELADYSAIALSIQDNGTGMGKDVQERAFEHLFTTKEVGKGTGLGLAIAHQIIVDNHNGSISFESSPGEGSKFTIILPIADGNDEKNSKVESSSRTPVC